MITAADHRLNSILIFIATEKFSAIEFRTVREVLVKEKFRIFITSSEDRICTGDDLSKVIPDVVLETAQPANFSALIIIGGKGIIAHHNDEALKTVIKRFYSAKKIIAAICAAPILLVRSGVLTKGEAACHPGCKQELLDWGIDYSDKDVTVTGNLITAKDAPSSAKFALTLIRKLREKND